MSGERNKIYTWGSLFQKLSRTKKLVVRDPFNEDFFWHHGKVVMRDGRTEIEAWILIDHESGGEPWGAIYNMKNQVYPYGKQKRNCWIPIEMLGRPAIGRIQKKVKELVTGNERYFLDVRPLEDVHTDESGWELIGAGKWHEEQLEYEKAVKMKT